MTGTIRAGIGGWTFEPWRGVFYPADVKQKEELAYASRALRVIEVNGTYYSSQKPETFAKWAAESPDGFLFTLKGSRFTTNRKVLAEAGESLERFLNSGIAELGDKLGPLLWQFAPTKKFDEADFGAFLALLPAKQSGLKLRHAVEVRHPSFVDPAFVALARKHGVAVVYAHHQAYPEFADVTADFVYARLQRGDDAVDTAYPAAELDAWAARCRAWASGGQPTDLPLVAPDAPPAAKPRDVFAFFIHEGKVRAPAAAQALQQRVDSAA